MSFKYLSFCGTTLDINRKGQNKAMTSPIENGCIVYGHNCYSKLFKSVKTHKICKHSNRNYDYKSEI